MSKKETFSRFEEMFWQVSKGMGYIWKQIFEQHFPGSQSFILAMLERTGPKRMSELSDSLYLTPGAVTLASNKLIEQGYITRIRDEKDRRVVYLDITKQGRETLEELRNEGRKTMNLVFSHLSEDDLQHLINVFEQASGNINGLRSKY